MANFGRAMSYTAQMISDEAARTDEPLDEASAHSLTGLALPVYFMEDDARGAILEQLFGKGSIMATTRQWPPSKEDRRRLVHLFAAVREDEKRRPKDLFDLIAERDPNYANPQTMEIAIAMVFNYPPFGKGRGASTPPKAEFILDDPNEFRPNLPESGYRTFLTSTLKELSDQRKGFFHPKTNHQLRVIAAAIRDGRLYLPSEIGNLLDKRLPVNPTRGERDTIDAIASKWLLFDYSEDERSLYVAEMQAVRTLVSSNIDKQLKKARPDVNVYGLLPAIWALEGEEEDLKAMAVFHVIMGTTFSPIDSIVGIKDRSEYGAKMATLIENVLPGATDTDFDESAHIVDAASFEKLNLPGYQWLDEYSKEKALFGHDGNLELETFGTKDQSFYYLGARIGPNKACLWTVQYARTGVVPFLKETNKSAELLSKIEQELSGRPSVVGTARSKDSDTTTARLSLAVGASMPTAVALWLWRVLVFARGVHPNYVEQAVALVPEKFINPHLNQMMDAIFVGKSSSSLPLSPLGRPARGGQ